MFAFDELGSHFRLRNIRGISSEIGRLDLRHRWRARCAIIGYAWCKNGFSTAAIGDRVPVSAPKREDCEMCGELTGWTASSRSE